MSEDKNINFNCPYCGEYTKGYTIVEEEGEFFQRCKITNCDKVFVIKYATFLSVLTGKVEWKPQDQ